MAKTKKEFDPTRICHNCRHHYDEHCKANDGHLILCRCPYFKWSRIQYSPNDACDRYVRITRT